MKSEGDRVSERDAAHAEMSVTVDRLTETHRRTLYELELCTRELENTREALQDACEEQEALRVKLSHQTAKVVEESRIVVTGDATTQDLHPHLDWAGRHYLAVSLPEDRMFKPSQSVTPVGVLQKLFEMWVGDRLAMGFSVFLENINIMLSRVEPEWYAKHLFWWGLHAWQ